MKLLHGDCREILKSLPDASVDSIVTDPPYELGFMGKSWDSTGVAYDMKMWQECLRVLKPGGHLLAFGGSRTYHRLACAIEDAGFDVRDQIMWVYGSGFPKSHNISKAIDKAAGVEREVIGQKLHARKGVASAEERTTIGAGAFGEARMGDITTPATDGAKQWDGWGTALKPAHEPIVMARKPLDGTVANNVLTHGTGGINVDDCRVDFVSDEDRNESTTKNQHQDFGTKPMTNNNVYGDYSMMQPANYDPTGRFPANFIHDGSEEVTELLGNAARFFYCAKASKAERNAGLDGFENKSAGEVTNRKEGSAGLQNPRAGAGRTTGNKNFHPTVKPIALMRYLVRLVTPPNGLVLDPFAGSGSTLVAATIEKFDCIGIEMTDEYLPIIEARVAHAKTDTLF
jgi:site-specific DNA-methyltransferase (adenine-specific)